MPDFTLLFAFLVGVAVTSVIALVVIVALAVVLVLRERHLLRRFEAADSVMWTQFDTMAGMKAHLLHLQGADRDEDDEDDGEEWKHPGG